jgi:hypothetical protein
MKTLALMLEWTRLSSRPPSAAIRANAIEIAMTTGVRALNRLAAAAGVIARLRTSSVPTICAASVTVRAST